MVRSDYLFKIIMVGDAGVGKSCLLTRFADGVYSERYVATIGVDYRVCTMVEDNGTVIKLQLWDTAGQERFRNIVNAYYRGAQLILLVFDLGDMDSFRNLEYWMSEIGRHISADTPCILVGAKCDGVQSMSAAAITNFVKKHNLTYLTCSARTGRGISELFTSISSILKAKHTDQKSRKANSQLSDRDKKTSPCSMCLPHY